MSATDVGPWPVVGAPGPSGAVRASLAKDRLGVFSVVTFALTAAAPLLVVGGLVTEGWALTGVIGLPLAFVLIGVVLAVFGTGYAGMARHVTNAGVFYSYVVRGGTRALGVSAAFVALLAYNLLQIGLYGGFGAFARGYVRAEFGWTAPWWGYALLAWAAVALMGALRVDLHGRVLAVLLVAEVAIVLICDVVDLAHPYAGGGSMAAFAPHRLFVAGAGAAFALAVTGFTGFEAAPVFAEESRDARRTVPAATFLALAVMGVVYAVTSWSIAAADGAGNVVADARRTSGTLILDTAGRYLGAGSPLVHIGNLLLLTSVFAALVSFHNTVTRYSFALGREGVLPRAAGRTRPRTGAPLPASAAQSALALVVIVIYAVAGWDPLAKLFFWLGTTGGVGVLLLLIATSLAVIAFFRRDQRGETVWTRLVAPTVAAIALAAVAYATFSGYAHLLGAHPGSPAAWVLPSLYGVAAVAGAGWALVLRVIRPGVYASIGLGAIAGIDVTALGVSTVVGESAVVGMSAVAAVSAVVEVPTDGVPEGEMHG